ncbi:hypothetical protein FACS189481_0420 [Clostridia bacterium]|nr:hypothetical protein FACS189481_0420 [Clostridia bacterium]
MLDWQNTAWERDQQGAEQDDDENEPAPIPFTFKTTASPGGSITTDSGPAVSIPATSEKQEPLIITLTCCPGYKLEKVLVGKKEYEPTDLIEDGNIIAFTYPLPGESITHDTSMHATISRIPNGQSSGV